MTYGKSGNFGKVDNEKWANHKFKMTGHSHRKGAGIRQATTVRIKDTRRGELGQSSIFYSDDDATDSAFKAARQVRYSRNGFGKAHRFPAAWAV